jgi:acetoin utilization deacetylase AcuC-like enzyme
MSLWLCWVLGVLFGTCLVVPCPAAAADAVRGSGTGAPSAIVSHPDYLLHDPGPHHPERAARLHAILSYLERQDWFTSLLQIRPAPAPEVWLTRIHTPAYLQRLQEAVRKAPVALDPDTRVSAHSYDVARLATGGVLAAVDAVMTGKARNAFVASRPPGHHALPERAMGFCLLNHVAIATRYVQEQYGVQRVLIVDWDVHHGNGTQEVFYTDPSVFYFSTHQYPYYPGTGAASETGEGPGRGTTLNVPLPAGAGDAEIIRAFREQLLPAAETFRPEFVFISAGFDAHQQDPLAQLQVTEAGYATLTRIVMDIAARYASGRIVSVLEGGYDLEALAHSVATHLRVLAAPE